MRFAQNAMAKNMQARCANTMFALLPQKCGKDAAQQRATDDKAVRRSLCGVALDNFREKIAHTGIFGVGEELVRRVLFQNLSFRHKHNA